LRLGAGKRLGIAPREGKVVLLSFGLLSANKGIENVIAALPAILAKHPNVVYFIVGATHPHVLKQDGETYRLSLQWLAQENGVEGQVIFYNRFVSLEELVEFIGAADIYITPYLNPAQIVSGTLAYTVGAGKAVISTPYWHAEEMLDDERGVLVPFRDPAALADQVTRLLDNDQQPVEAQGMVSACLEAFRVTGDKRWRQEARRAFDWFLGRNDLNLPIYDPTTGGCRDGLHPDRANENQGAESSLAFLQSLLELRLAENALLTLETVRNEQPPRTLSPS
jgi:glycosyltransferase involved in cell wall biosynthesis